eukprot:1814393-Ditylum_brightwellii.AAC.1
MEEGACVLFGASIVVHHPPSYMSSDITFAFLQKAQSVTNQIDEDPSITVSYAGNKPVEAEVTIKLT